MPETFTRWDVTEDLRTKEDVRLYLEACAEEDPGDGSLIRAALNDIARAQNRYLYSRDRIFNDGQLVDMPWPE